MIFFNGRIHYMLVHEKMGHQFSLIVYFIWHRDGVDLLFIDRPLYIGPADRELVG